jgi:lipoprotein-releasing system ATP-binding protein
VAETPTHAESADAPPLIAARDVTRTLPDGVTLVRDITLSIGRGEFVAVTGPSGSGKSSLLYLLGLLDRPTTGEVLLEGQDTARLSAKEMAALRLARLGFVFQFHFLLPEFSTLDNVLIPIRRLGRLRDAAARARAMHLLDLLGLADAARKLPEQLSGGMRQRVAIARALANDPALILADEPTGNLDTKNAAAVFATFGRLVAEEGRTVIVVTHDPGLAARATRQVHLVDGRILYDEATKPAGATP